MAYVSPTIVPSGTTFAQLRSGGFQGQLIRLATANTFTPAVRSLVTGPMDAIKTGIVHAVDAYLQGDPVLTADINAKLLVYATALKAIAAALEEANVLVDANPGTVATQASRSPSGGQKRRSFP